MGWLIPDRPLVRPGSREGTAAMTKMLTDWSQEDREQHCNQVMRGGWSRVGPPVLPILLVGMVMDGSPFTREELAPFVRTVANPDGALSATCWESAEDSEDQEILAKVMADSARYAAHYGLPPLQTVDDVITLLVTAQVVREVPDEAGLLRLHPAHPLPTPANVFPLEEEERVLQRRMRIDAAYEGDSYRIIKMFEPTDERREEITTSLDRLARTIDGSPYDAQQAVQLLLDNGDFTTSVDIAELPPHKVFRLRCDWEKFDASRIGIHGQDDEGRLVVTLPEDLDPPAGEGDPQ